MIQAMSEPCPTGLTLITPDDRTEPEFASVWQTDPADRNRDENPVKLHSVPENTLY